MGRRRVTLANEMCRWLPAGQGPPAQQWTPRNKIARRQERPARASPLFNLDTRKPPTVNSLEDILEHLRHVVLPRSRAQHRVAPRAPDLKIPHWELRAASSGETALWLQGLFPKRLKVF